MGERTLLDAVNGGEYDPRCTRIEVALRAIWVLYLRDQWNLLDSIGLRHADFEVLFWAYRQRLEDRDLSPRIRTDQQTVEFLRFTQAWGHREAIRLLSAAVWMVGEYMNRRRRVRAAWYGRMLEDDE